MMTKGEGYASKNTIYTLNRGTRRLQRLINQLMEFRKINTGNMKLNVERAKSSVSCEASTMISIP